MQTFTVNDDEDTARAAAVAYVWRRFRARVWWFIGGALMWCAAIVYFWTDPNGQFFVGVFSVCLFFYLAYLPTFLFAMPRGAAQEVRRSPYRSVTLQDDRIEISTADRSIALAWDQFKALWEYPGLSSFR